jgi:c-di-GMP-binding flagellar brake protein YcgR
MQAVTEMDQVENAEDRADAQEKRRADPRYGVDEDAHLLLVKHGSTLACRVVDLSLGGCRLWTQDRFPASAEVYVEVTFRVRGLAFRFSGITRWTDGQHLVGIHFANVPARRKEELVEALSEIDEENAAKAAKQAAEEQAATLEAAAALEAAASPEVNEAEQQAARKFPVQTPAQARVPTPFLTRAAQPLAPARSRSAAPSSGAEHPTGKAGASVSGVIHAPAGPALVVQPVADRPLAEQSDSAVRPGLGSSQLRPLEKEEIPAAGLPTTKAVAANRRAQFREHIDASAVIDLIKIASRLKGRILDLSLGGCRIRTLERFPVGIYTRVEIEFSLEGLPFRLGGVIQAIHDRNTVGIRFLDMSSRRREQVELLMEEIHGRQNPEE